MNTKHNTTSNIDEAIYPLTLYFDGACALCNAEMENLRIRDNEARLRFVNIAALGFDPTTTGASWDELMSTLHARTADGRLLRGVDAIRAAYTAVGFGAVMAALGHPLLARLAEHTYPWVARNRNRLPRRLVQLVVERAARRAAKLAAHQRCTPDGVCRIEPGAHNSSKPLQH
jgi:predicted DCC family thiol-disulfide oxidoreductase YuxK